MTLAKTIQLCVVSLIAIGLIALSSVVGGSFFFKQIVFAVIAFVVAFLVHRVITMEFLQKISWLVYVFNIGLLIALKFFGSTILGSQRWIKLGPISIQPSEFAKVFLIIFLAAWLLKNPIKGFGDIFKALFFIAIPSFLVLVQPDLGTTLVYAVICFGMLLWAGASIVQLLILVSPIITAVLSAVKPVLYSYHHGALQFEITLPALVFLLLFFTTLFFYYQAWRSPLVMSLVLGLFTLNAALVFTKTFLWNLLKDYQQQRLTIFLDPYSDPLGAGYHIIQSLYAIGSGGLWGQGLKQGDLTQGEYVPEQHTDFIFSAIGEELGFVGALLVILIYAVLAYSMLRVAETSNSQFVSLLAVGTFSMMFFHIFVNIGMNLSVMPITGVPLPFMSYGGSAMLVNLFLVGLVIAGAQDKRQ